MEDRRHIEILDQIACPLLFDLEDMGLIRIEVADNVPWTEVERNLYLTESSLTDEQKERYQQMLRRIKNWNDG